MGGVITGFTIIATVIAIGYLLGLHDLLGDSGRDVLTRLAFHVANPALLFVILADADLGVLFSPSLLATALSTVATASIFVAVGAARRWGAARVTIGALCSAYVNAGNLGIPIALYVLGDASLVAPILLLQQLAITPTALTVLDMSTARDGGGERRTVVQRLTTPFRNPIVIGSLSGIAVAASGTTLPSAVLGPATLVGDMAVPAILLAFGISLRGSAFPARGAERGPVLLSVALKSLAHPAIAWVTAAWLFRLDPAEQLNVVVTSALPAAQNLFTYASHYATDVRLARESILLSTILAGPVIALVVALLGP
ncbi:AEC family transporter [Streptomyces sp. NBC_01803]|uniref:AEC family transporter n=1 Tax=Streptomyces sp. NBC_01803 TaxID=2975946 RepID=UPI002DDA7C90|nr:AEC family transporter [Streptomyces sp. NBC_01803]WSA45416.1 AEC family transporter [Streptomyces sp. NBC_01803]